MERITVRLTAEQHERISDLAYAQGQSLNTEIQRAVTAWCGLERAEREKLLGKLPGRKPRRAMIPAPASK